MRDPWVPLLAMAIILLGTVLGIVGPVEIGATQWLLKWQTLISASIAVMAAYIAYQNTTRSLAHAGQLETHRRERKHTALRAMLPLALAQICNYAHQTAQSLGATIAKCEDEVLPLGTLGGNFVKSLPNDTLKLMTEFMEYSDNVNVNVFASTVALIQVHESRLFSMIRENQSPLGSSLTLRTTIEQSILDAASIFAGSSSGFDYARRRSNTLPGELELLWSDVANAMRSMGFYEHEHPRLYDMLNRQKKLTLGPFKRIKTPH